MDRYPILQAPDEEVQKIGAAIAEKLNMNDYVPDKMVGRHVS
jgi:hypothetical protein